MSESMRSWITLKRSTRQSKGSKKSHLVVHYCVKDIFESIASVHFYPIGPPSKCYNDVVVVVVVADVVVVVVELFCRRSSCPENSSSVLRSCLHRCP